MRRQRLVAPTVVALLVGVGVAGCSDGSAVSAGSAGSAESAGSAGAPAGTPSTPAGHGDGTEFNPCSDLTPAFVESALGVPVTEDSGTAANPRCAFVPARSGAPALEVNYVVFTGPLDEVFAMMGPVAGTTRTLDLPTADDARLVVNASEDGIALTGFVQTGALVEVVNTVALAPYDRDTVVRGTRAIMRRLSERAAARAS